MLLYADENFPLPVVAELRRLGHDVLTAQDDGLRATPDPALCSPALIRSGEPSSLTIAGILKRFIGKAPAIPAFCRQLATMILPACRLESTPHLPARFKADGASASIVARHRPAKRLDCQTEREQAALPQSVASGRQLARSAGSSASLSSSACHGCRARAAARGKRNWHELF